MNFFFGIESFHFKEYEKRDKMQEEEDEEKRRGVERTLLWL